MNVRDLVSYLLTQDQDLPVTYRIHSEQCLLEYGDIEVVDLCLPRSDGWVQNKRPDMPTQPYLQFPGN